MHVEIQARIWIKIPFNLVWKFHPRPPVTLRVSGRFYARILAASSALKRISSNVSAGKAADAAIWESVLFAVRVNLVCVVTYISTARRVEPFLRWRLPYYITIWTRNDKREFVTQPNRRCWATLAICNIRRRVFSTPTECDSNYVASAGTRISLFGKRRVRFQREFERLVITERLPSSVKSSGKLAMPHSVQ